MKNINWLSIYKFIIDGLMYLSIGIFIILLLLDSEKYISEHIESNQNTIEIHPSDLR